MLPTNEINVFSYFFHTMPGISPWHCALWLIFRTEATEEMKEKTKTLQQKLWASHLQAKLQKRRPNEILFVNAKPILP